MAFPMTSMLMPLAKRSSSVRSSPSACCMDPCVRMLSWLFLTTHQVSKSITRDNGRLTIRGSSLSMGSVLLEPTKQPGDALLVVLVVLALDDDLLEAMSGIIMSTAGGVCP